MRKSTAIILVCAAVFAGWVFYSLVHVEPVRVVKSALQRSGGQVFVAGELANSGPDEGPIDIEVRYYDARGRALGSDKIVVPELKHGSDASFKSPARALGGVADYSIYLNHGRNPYGN
jgi:hypothetical protein